MTKFNLIPFPSDLQTKPGNFSLGNNTLICPDPDNKANATYLQRLLKPGTGFSFEIKQPGESELDFISLVLNPDLSQLGDEGYQISISEEAIHLRALTTTGIFYAIQTLRQLLPVEIEKKSTAGEIDWSLPCVEIEDVPQFPWRGFMLDEGRYFQGINTVKKLLDQMALLKLNRFHWHLTDDQGWRIEIKQYPLLTEIGSKRAGTVVGNPYTSRKHDQIPHEGFYTQDEIREVIAYARDRHIMVIPEIELPGHSTAALAAYPELGCTGRPIEIPTRWGIFRELYCAGKPETLTFLENVLNEVVDLFPASFIHIGGDESPKTRWKVCPNCQKKIAEEHLKDEHALQVFLMNQISAYLSKYGKRIIFWSDSFDHKIDPSAIVHFWIGNRSQILESVRAGREMISSPYLSTYLDLTYATIPLKKSQAFDPVFHPLPTDTKGRVLGFEGLMWGEWLPNYRRVEYQTFPRLIALAEAGWRRQRVPSKDFIRRLENYLKRLVLMDIGYAPLAKTRPTVWQWMLKYLKIALPKTGISLPVEK